MMLMRLGRGIMALRNLVASALPTELSDENGTFVLATEDGRLLILE